MYTLRPSKRYVKAFKRLSRSGRFEFEALNSVLNVLAAGRALPAQYANHPLHGAYRDCFECHLKSDLLLIYKIDEHTKTVVVMNLGSHSELFR